MAPWDKRPNEGDLLVDFVRAQRDRLRKSPKIKRGALRRISNSGLGIQNTTTIQIACPDLQEPSLVGNLRHLKCQRC
jgi:hypothetical protein